MSDIPSNPTSRVTASTFLKQWGLYSERAQREPVTITSHGRDSLVLISAEEFARLKATGGRTLTEEWQEAIEKATPPKTEGTP